MARRIRRPKDRAEARLAIIQAANRHHIRHGYSRHGATWSTRFALPLFDLRTLNRAVAVVRHHGLVKPEVLELAGFNAKRRAF